MNAVYAPIRISLTLDEMALAEKVGSDRYNQSRLMGIKDIVVGDYGRDGLRADFVGAAGELAFCKAAKTKWRQDVNTFKAPDVFKNTQVRTSPCKLSYPPIDFGTLIIRPKDNPQNYYVLVVGNPPHFIIQGWIFGKMAMTPEWFRNSAPKAAWFVPHRHLNKEFTKMFQQATI